MEQIKKYYKLAKEHKFITMAVIIVIIIIISQVN